MKSVLKAGVKDLIRKNHCVMILGGSSGLDNLTKPLRCLKINWLVPMRRINSRARHL